VKGDNVMDLREYGYLRVGAAVPEIKIADPEFNREVIFKMIKEAEEKGIKVLTFPELSITGYSCGDLFNQDILLDAAERELEKLIVHSRLIDMFIIVGMPVRVKNELYNCGVAFYKGTIYGVVPKVSIPNYSEFYEKRWFSKAPLQSIKIVFCGQEVEFGNNILFEETRTKSTIAIEICEDLWTPNPPSIKHCMAGANVVVNLSASNEVVGKYEYRKNLVKQHSASCISAYVYCSAGITESTSDVLFSGHTMISENGGILAEDRFNIENSLIYSDIDIQKLNHDRRAMNSYMSNPQDFDYSIYEFNFDEFEVDKLEHPIDPHPFVPNDNKKRDERCEEIFTIQSLSLAQRLKKTGINKVVIGVSGGLDSTLALLVCKGAMEKLNLPMSNIIGITMPGFGTTGKTYNNSIELMKLMGTTIHEISIKEACLQHFKDIGQDPNNYDITYENAQARERTQILMDMANKEGALVVGTGDLSEIALGWCTFNADHMSMYSVNCSVPKTLVKHLVGWEADNYSIYGLDDILPLDDDENVDMATLLRDILNTTVSPELLPPDENDNIQQSTEDSVGPYELHDFFLYNMIRFGYSPAKIYMLANNTKFNVDYTGETIKKWLKVFYRRFFTQQFKRNAMPDGPKVGSISLSQRGDWRMPSDACFNLWLSEVDRL
jgi:NAD+ synthase (glutamine-hydrolysing)